MIDLDWKNLDFSYIKTNGFVICEYKDNEWGEIKFQKDPYISMHIASQVFHYGQACFEGIKAFRTKNNEVVIFRPEMNAQRLKSSAQRLCMQYPSEDLFLEACKKAVKHNIDFVPPYGTGASLYIRPVLIGSEPVIGVNPSKEYKFIIFVMPVGPYYKSGFKPVEAFVIDNYDRSAPQGTGSVKAAGNYAAGLKANSIAKSKGYSIVLYLDSKEKKYVDEFGTSNFIGITKNNEFKTPLSSSILPSITNDSLQTIAKDMGLNVIKEKIAFDNLDQFSEVGACGTAAVITPIYSIKHNDKEIKFGDKNKAGNKLTELFNTLQSIQYGENVDKYGWLLKI